MLKNKKSKNLIGYDIWEYPEEIDRRFFYIQSFSLTECIGIVRVGKYRVVCPCVCLSVCLFALERRNCWADFNETFHKGSPIYLVVCV